MNGIKLKKAQLRELEEVLNNFSDGNPREGMLDYSTQKVAKCLDQQAHRT